MRRATPRQKWIVDSSWGSAGRPIARFVRVLQGLVQRDQGGLRIVLAERLQGDADPRDGVVIVHAVAALGHVEPMVGQGLRRLAVFAHDQVRLGQIGDEGIGGRRIPHGPGEDVLGIRRPTQRGVQARQVLVVDRLARIDSDRSFEVGGRGLAVLLDGRQRHRQGSLGHGIIVPHVDPPRHCAIASS